jgi:hypothetical protein
MTRTGGLQNDNKPCEDSKREGIKGWLDRNKKWIEPTIVASLFLTGNYGIGSVMLLLWIVDTM